jgi:hypothetical protein
MDTESNILPEWPTFIRETDKISAIFEGCFELVLFTDRENIIHISLSVSILGYYPYVIR